LRNFSLTRNEFTFLEVPQKHAAGIQQQLKQTFEEVTARALKAA
jgi:hypothetical protein